MEAAAGDATAFARLDLDAQETLWQVAKRRQDQAGSA
jgi:hypothetical protein